ncbi:MAG: hypothetical protein ABSG95_00605 [Solirubrobacteraceae bacterium]|jgi:hypothetical protein
MPKKVLVSVAPLLAIAAFAVTPVVAQAAGPRWYSDGKPIKEGERVLVATSGALTFHVRAATGAEVASIKCKVKDKENIFNTNEAGLDEITAFVLSGCKIKPSPCPAGTTGEIIVKGLPWATRLIPGPPIRDEVAGVELEARCSGTHYLTFKGTLTPEVGNSVLTFGSGSGQLVEPGFGLTAEITGTDKLKGPKGDTKITAA